MAGRPCLSCPPQGDGTCLGWRVGLVRKPVRWADQSPLLGVGSDRVSTRGPGEQPCRQARFDQLKVTDAKTGWSASGDLRIRRS